MSTPSQHGAGLPSQPQHSQHTQVTQPTQQQQQQQQQQPHALFPAYGPMAFMNPPGPTHSIIPQHFLGAVANQGFFMGAQAAYIFGAGVPAPSSALAPSTPFGLEASAAYGVAPSTGPSQTFPATPITRPPAGQQQEQVPQEQTAQTSQHGVQSLCGQGESSSSFAKADDGQGQALGQSSAVGPPSPPKPFGGHAQDAAEPPGRLGASAPSEQSAAETPTSVPSSISPSPTKLLETVLHVDKPLAHLGEQQPHRTLISADPHWLCMLEESQTIVSYQSPSSLSQASRQEGEVRVPMRRLCFRLQFCPDPHMAEFRTHALQFTTLQIVGYGSQQVELTQRISGHDLVNKGLKVHVDPRQVLYNNRSSYGFSVVLSNQPMSQLTTLPRPPARSSIAPPSVATETDPGLGASLEVQLTSAYCRRNLAEMLKDTATADTVIYIVPPRSHNSAPSSSSTAESAQSTQSTQSTAPSQLSQRHSQYPTATSQRHPTQHEHHQHHHPEVARALRVPNTNSQQYTLHQHQVAALQASAPRAAATPPQPTAASTSGSHHGISQAVQATAVGTEVQATVYEHGVQEVPSQTVQHDVTRLEVPQQRSSSVASPPALLARPLATPPSQHRSVSPAPVDRAGWPHYRQQPQPHHQNWQQPLEHQQHSQYQQHTQNVAFVQQRHHVPSSPWPEPHLQAAVHNSADFPPHSNFATAHGPAPQVYQRGQSTPQGPPLPQQQPQPQPQEQQQEIEEGVVLRAHYVILKNYSKINKMVQILPTTRPRSQIQYKLVIELHNPHLMRVLLEYLYTHQIAAPQLITHSPTSDPSSSSTTSARPSSPSSSSSSSSSSSASPSSSGQYTYTWRELYELAERFGLHTLARLVKCALLSELTPETVQSQLLEWVYQYEALFPAYVKYAIDQRVDLLNAVQDWRREAAAAETAEVVEAEEEGQMELEADEQGGAGHDHHSNNSNNSNNSNSDSSSSGRRVGDEGSDRLRREQARQAAAAERYFRHTPCPTSSLSGSASRAGPTGNSSSTSDATSSSMVWSHPKYRNVVARYTMFLDGHFALPTGFEAY
ncbi:hypothetical protein DFQ27_004128 [Actinomortierella ambigua]|uniref:BTB domain-containing protein n=1 Tax=Actinomortierella ambigua TaxID=1343610 RepID=A0A9P6Q664_9FUNG|nr:hypothetical protein DFQ27_004128 [Actinomortierella ambigua]